MASDYDDDSGRSAADELIRQARIELQVARNRMFEERVGSGGVSQQTRRQLAVATLKLWDTLHEERDHRDIKDQWASSEVGKLDAMLSETVEQAQETAGAGRNTATQTVPAIVAADIGWLDQVSREVKEIANELGKGPSVTDPTPENEASMSDLRGLLKARGQSEALTHLPEVEDGG
jgi:hypothetical protein